MSAEAMVSDAELAAIYARIDRAVSDAADQCDGDELAGIGLLSTEVCDLIGLRAALTERVAAAAAERDDARAEVETMRAEHALLRSIIEGRTTPPTDAEIAAHEARKGRWLLSHPSSHVHDHRVCYVLDPGTSDIRSEAAHPHDGSRFVALDADGRPCAWPTVTP